MSELRIGLAVEGGTDALVLQAGLDAFLDKPFVAVQLQPEVPPGKTGAGWGGVFWWCRQVGTLGYETLDSNPMLEHIDLAIIQIDADVAAMSYESANISRAPNDDLPCEFPCPPASDTVHALQKVVVGWLALSRPGKKTVICIPSKCIEAWVAAALYGATDSGVLENLECSYDIVNYLHRKPSRERLIKMQPEPGKARRLRKIKTRFQKAQPRITSSWAFVTQACPQAKAFQKAVVQAVQDTGLARE
jgi:hypothetical protein